MRCPLLFLSFELGPGTYLSQETLYRSQSYKRKVRKTAHFELPGMATQVRPAYRRRDLWSSNVCRSIWQVSFVPSSPAESEFYDRDAKYSMHTRAEGELMFCMQLP